MNPPKIFISATSGDLSSARQIAKEALLTINCHPVEQTNFEPDWRSVTDMLRGKIGDCQALIHLVGFRYGAEPDPATLPPDTPRRSYTQMEYHLARELGLRVYTFLLPETYPFDLPAKADTPEQTQLQAAHRALIQNSPHVYDDRPTNNLELRTRIIALQEQVISLEQEQQSTAKEVENLASTLTTGQNQLGAQLSIVTAKIEQQAKNIKLPRLAQCRKDMLAKVRYDWIEGVLIPSVNESNRFNIGQELVPSAVVTDHRFPDREFGPEDDVAKLFDDSNSRLLILGNPGGGKTMLLLRLAEQLLERAEKDPTVPIPIVLNLSSWWRDRLPLDQWMIREGATAYQIPIAIMTRWVRDEAITPLLDGLDEVGLGSAAREAWAERTNLAAKASPQAQDDGIEGAAAKEARAACLEAINRYCQPNKNDPDSQTSVGIVVCSRSTEYAELTDKLRLNGALMLRDLSDCQVHSVLYQEHMKGVRGLVEHEPWITSMSMNPFLLNVMSAAYAGKSLAIKSSQTRRLHHLMGEYVNLQLRQSLGRRQASKALDATQARYLLNWLATRMGTSGQTVFHIESLQMTWLSRLWARCAYCIGTRLFFGFSMAVILTPLMILGFCLLYASRPNIVFGWQLFMVMGSVGIWGASLLMPSGVIASVLEWQQTTASLSIAGRMISWLQFCFVGGLILGPCQTLLTNLGHEFSVSSGFTTTKPTTYSIPFSIGMGLNLVAFYFVGIWLCSKMGIRNLAAVFGVAAFLSYLSQSVVVLFNVDFWALQPLAKISSMIFICSVSVGAGVLAAFVSNFGNYIQSAEHVEWKWSPKGSVAMCGLILMLFSVFLVWGFVTGHYKLDSTRVVQILLVCGIGFVFGGVVFGVKRSDVIQRRSIPNEGVVKSLKSSALISIGFGLIALLAVVGSAIVLGVTPGEITDSAKLRNSGFGALISVLVALMATAGAFAGGLDVPVKHWTLRMLLRTSERIPIRLARSLDEIREILLIRKVGGGFMFTHRYLQEYFDGRKILAKSEQ